MGFRGGWSTLITTENLMKDLRTQPSLSQQLHLGAAKAHRAVSFSHYEYRNINRGLELKKSTVGQK